MTNLLASYFELQRMRSIKIKHISSVSSPTLFGTAHSPHYSHFSHHSHHSSHPAELINFLSFNFTVVDFVLHEKGLCNEFVELLLIAGLMVKVHESVLAIEFVEFFGLVYSMSHFYLANLLSLHF